MIDLDAEIVDRLVTAGRLLREVRRAARLSQQDLAARARLNERTIRRIECGEAALINSYWSLAYALGLPADWFVRAHELTGVRSDPEEADRQAEAGLENLTRTGWFGPEAIAYLREYVAFGRDEPGPAGPVEAFASGHRLTLQRSLAEAARRHSRR